MNANPAQLHAPFSFYPTLPVIILSYEKAQLSFFCLRCTYDDIPAAYCQVCQLFNLPENLAASFSGSFFPVSTVQYTLV